MRTFLILHETPRRCTRHAAACTALRAAPVRDAMASPIKVACSQEAHMRCCWQGSSTKRLCDTLMVSSNHKMHMRFPALAGNMPSVV